MEGRKLKNIVIIILLLLNLFLLVPVGGRRMQDARSRDAARAGAIQVMQNAGIALDETIVPDRMALESLLGPRDLLRERDLAAGLLGESLRVDSRGGEVYRYTSSRGWIQFHSTGEFLAEFVPGAFSPDVQTIPEHAAQILSLLDFASQPAEDTITDGEGSITLRQTIDGVPVLNGRATLNYRGGSLVSISSGRMLPGSPEPTGEVSSLSVATALMRLYNGLRGLGDVCNRVERIVPAYTLSVSLSGPARLDPIWYVKTDTGSYQLDTRTGQLSRLSAADALS